MRRPSRNISCDCIGSGEACPTSKHSGRPEQLRPAVACRYSPKLATISRNIFSFYRQRTTDFVRRSKGDGYDPAKATHLLRCKRAWLACGTAPRTNATSGGAIIAHGLATHAQQSTSAPILRIFTIAACDGGPYHRGPSRLCVRAQAIANALRARM
jgi:hypothetical protein